jgi:hypothetical protein
LGNPTNKIQFSSKVISRVDIYDRKTKGKNRYPVYCQSWPKYQAAKYFLFTIIGLAAITAIYFLIKFVIEALVVLALFRSFCYIATMVYGSYDAPEVLVLRKFRDEKLQPYFLGRLFIRIYYALSPAFVYFFKNNKPVNKFIKCILDKWVVNLKRENVIFLTTMKYLIIPNGNFRTKLKYHENKTQNSNLHGVHKHNCIFTRCNYLQK